MTARLYVGDVRKVLGTLPDSSVDLVLASPPFLALRSYLPPDHPDKAKEIGGEATPGEFLDVLLDVVEECCRVLAPHGSLCFELGDTYAGSGGAGGDYNEGGLRDGQERFDGSNRRQRMTVSARRDRVAVPRNLSGGHGWPLDKSLTLVPELFRVALAYGFNPLTGRETERWRVRNVVRWCRPNPTVGDLGDKVRPATSELVVACTARDRWFDLDAVRLPASEWVGKYGGGQYTAKDRKSNSNRQDRGQRNHEGNPGGAPPLDWWGPNDEEQALWDEWADAFAQEMWIIPTKGYTGSHYAVWPPALCTRPIEAMCPRRVCRTCGEPSRRLSFGAYVGEPDDSTRAKESGRLNAVDHPPEKGWERTRSTLGWTVCGCPGTGEADVWKPGWRDAFASLREAGAVVRRAKTKDAKDEARRLVQNRAETLGEMWVGREDGFHEGEGWRPGVVLDPFAGTATTLAVAQGHSRDAWGIDLDSRNVELARGRLGMFLEVIGA